ncbi:acetoacetate-CoA ligase [Sarocladium strictum]
MSQQAADQEVPRQLWRHSDPRKTAMHDFMIKAGKTTGHKFSDWHALYKWSIDHPSDFWTFTFKYFPIVYTGQIPNPVVDESARMSMVPKWFAGVKLNFAENILYTRASSDGCPGVSSGKEDDKVACTQVREGGSGEPILHITWAELRTRVGRLEQAMKAHGVRKGDRVAVVGSVCADTLTVFLATTALGAIFSSNSTDLGVAAVLDRLSQIQPKLVFMDDYAVYRGSTIDLRPKVRDIISGLRKSSPEFQGVVIQARFQKNPADISSLPLCQTWKTFESAAPNSNLEFEKMDFSDPMIILYSSGTTGQAKCIMHSVGGIILSGHKESTLHRLVDHTSTQLQFTTTSWMMYLSAVQLLLTGARLVMYDGHPFTPSTTALLQLTADEKVTHLGISPRYLQTLQAEGTRPRESFDLSHLKVVTSTGMVLSEALFEWFYDQAFPSNVLLANISGGTDIVAAFGTCNPLLPLYVGGCQCISLGMAVDVFDSRIEGGKGVKGRSIAPGEAGELVCTKPFPTMPVRFWGDETGTRYYNSYFAKYDDCWTHGDFITIHPQTKQITMLGRADGVLNPSGIRFGSSEIYNILNIDFADAIADSICVGQRRPQDDDERVMLFVLMQPGKRLSAKLVKQVKQQIRSRLSSRHVPKFIFETPEIPTTLNGKKVELPVKHIVSGRKVEPSSSLANPGSLQFYYAFATDEVLECRPGEELQARL